ncbi:hypothetical protein ACYF6T_38110 [Streptomyces sp. 7R007]
MPTDTETGASRSPGDAWGAVEFQGSDGQPILRVPLSEWLPETGLIGLLELSPEECLERTGMRLLVSHLRIPWGEAETTAPSGRTNKENPGRPDRAIHQDLPVWHNWVRGIGMLLWFTFFLLLPMAGAGSGWTVLTAITGLFLLPGADLLVRLLLWSRRRKDVSLEEAEVIVPSPEPGAGATRRFCDTAAVRVLPGDVVLTNTVGEERWLPRHTAQGVTHLARMLDPSSGTVLGVELRDRAGAARALLPWQWWFVGPSGPQNWNRLVAALDVPVSDEKAQRSQPGSHWWTGHLMAADARQMAPIDAKEARRETSWHSAVVGDGEVIVVPIFSLIPLAGFGSGHALAQAAASLAALTILAELVPVISHRLNSRCRLDRPIDPEST